MDNLVQNVSDLEAHIGYWLRYVSNHVSSAFRKQLESSGVTVAEWAVMRKLYLLGQCPPSALAEAMGMTRGAISKLTDRLVHKELITRASIGQDKRYQQIALTESGRVLVPQLAKLADENDAKFFAHLSQKQKDIFVAILKETVQTHHLRKVPVE